MGLRPLFEWLENSPLGAGVRSSTYAFALVECFHLIGMVCLLGSILTIDLRLTGLLLRALPTAKVTKALSPVTWAGLATMLASGVLLLSSEAVKCYDNPAFAWKMGLLAAALILYSTLHRRVTGAEAVHAEGFTARAVGVVSLALWFGVALAGRAIAFV
jgi:hypothetical protein